jgi:hypothetical protein
MGAAPLGCVVALSVALDGQAHQQIVFLLCQSQIQIKKD